MKKLILITVSCLLFITAWESTGQEPERISADLILRNGRIYTVDASRSWVQSIAVSNGVIIAIGSNRELEVWSGENTTVIDLENRMG